MAYALLVVALLLNACANVFLKVGVARLAGASDAGLFSRLLENRPLQLGLLLFAGNVVCYIGALGRLELSVAYPVMVTGSLLVVVVSSMLWLGETVTALQWFGIVLLLIGILLVTGRTPE